MLAAGSSRPSCIKIIYAAFFPFLLALLASLSLLRRGDVAAAPATRRAGRGALEAHDTLPGCEDGRGCGAISTLPAVEVAGANTGRGTLQTLAAAATAIGGGSSSSSLGSAHPDGSTSSSSSSEGGLEPLFLFIGILSGRGYRHRRLAVREAWATRAQTPGLVISKFILSEDERTPQVQKELEMYNDIVFVKEKTNYKSILYKTFYVSAAAALAGLPGHAGPVWGPVWHLCHMPNENEPWTPAVAPGDKIRTTRFQLHLGPGRDVVEALVICHWLRLPVARQAVNVCQSHVSPHSPAGS